MHLSVWHLRWSWLGATVSRASSLYCRCPDSSIAEKSRFLSAVLSADLKSTIPPSWVFFRTFHSVDIWSVVDSLVWNHVWNFPYTPFCPGANVVTQNVREYFICGVKGSDTPILQESRVSFLCWWDTVLPPSGRQGVTSASISMELICW